jgi:hypothetical protein
MHDLLIRGGRVIDTTRGWDGPLDVAVDGQVCVSHSDTPPS